MLGRRERVHLEQMLSQARARIVELERELRARKQTRVHDISCRGAGDEFVVLMPETDLEGAAVCC